MMSARRTPAPEGMVAVELTPTERIAKALELAKVALDIDQAREDHALVARAHREAVKALEERRAALAEDVESGSELRDAQLEMPLGGRNGKRRGADA